MTTLPGDGLCAPWRTWVLSSLLGLVVWVPKPIDEPLGFFYRPSLGKGPEDTCYGEFARVVETLALQELEVNASDSRVPIK